MADGDGEPSVVEGGVAASEGEAPITWMPAALGCSALLPARPECDIHARRSALSVKMPIP